MSEEAPQPQRRLSDAAVKAVTQAGIARGILLNQTGLALVRARLLEAGATLEQIAKFGPSIRTEPVPTPETFTPRNRRERRAQQARHRRTA